MRGVAVRRRLVKTTPASTGTRRDADVHRNPIARIRREARHVLAALIPVAHVVALHDVGPTIDGATALDVTRDRDDDIRARIESADADVRKTPHLGRGDRFVPALLPRLIDTLHDRRARDHGRPFGEVLRLRYGDGGGNAGERKSAVRPNSPCFHRLASVATQKSKAT